MLRTPHEFDEALSYAVHRQDKDAVKDVLPHAYVNTVQYENVGKCNDLRKLEEADRLYPDDTRYDFDRPRVIHDAFLNRDYAIMELLLQAGANTSAWFIPGNDSRPTPWCWAGVEGNMLHLAAEAEDLEMVKLLVKYGADVNDNECYGKSPVFVSTDNNNIPMTKFLLENGANPNIPCCRFNRQYPVSNCLYGDDEMLDILLKHGIDINVVYRKDIDLRARGDDDIDDDEVPMTMLDIAASGYALCETDEDKQEALGLIKCLLDYNVDPEIQYAVFQEYRRVDYSSSTQELKDLMLDYKYKQTIEYYSTLSVDELNAVDCWGKTFLHRSAENGDEAAVDYLLSKGVHAYKLDFWGHTPEQSTTYRGKLRDWNVANNWHDAIPIYDDEILVIMNKKPYAKIAEKIATVANAQQQHCC